MTKTVKTEIIISWLTQKPRCLEIVVEYHDGFILHVFKPIGRGALSFGISVNYSELSFFQDEIDFMHQILDDASTIASLKLNYRPKTFGSLEKWARDIRDMIDAKLNNENHKNHD